VSLGAVPAGGPILCDADADGVLETVVADASGRLHSFGWNGVEELHWPRSIWNEDDPNPPAQATGPRALDVNQDGQTEILLHRADGVLVALDGQGRDLPGWPRSFGSLATSGPLWLAGGAGHTPRFVVGNAYGSTNDGGVLTALSAMRAPGTLDEGLGIFPAAGVNGERTRVYPRAWIPSPSPSPAVPWSDTVRLYPNPLRGDELTVHFLLDSPARVQLEAFDLSGRKVADLTAQGVEGANGNSLYWNLASLTPGLYQVRFRLLGQPGRSEQEIFRKLAIVR